MSTLSAKSDELREAAEKFEGYQSGEISRMMREAADTIESLRNTLQELQGVGGESRYTALFGTPERAAQTLMNICDECDESACSGCKIDPLIGYTTNYDALLEWLGGDA